VFFDLDRPTPVTKSQVGTTGTLPNGRSRRLETNDKTGGELS